MTENELAAIVYKLGMKVHIELGPGLLEKIYEECLFYELTNAGILVEQQKKVPVIYNGITLNHHYMVDLMIENKIILELKSVDQLNSVHLAQTLTYLKLTNCKLGLLINFNVHLFKNGVQRIINGQL